MRWPNSIFGPYFCCLKVVMLLDGATKRRALMLEVFPFTLFVSVKQRLQTAIFVSTKSKKLTHCRFKSQWCVLNLWCYHLNCHAQMLCSIKLLQQPKATMPSTVAALFKFIRESDVLSKILICFPLSIIISQTRSPSTSNETCGEATVGNFITGT